MRWLFSTWLNVTCEHHTIWRHRWLRLFGKEWRIYSYKVED